MFNENTVTTSDENSVGVGQGTGSHSQIHLRGGKGGGCCACRPCCALDVSAT